MYSDLPAVTPRQALDRHLPGAPQGPRPCPMTLFQDVAVPGVLEKPSDVWEETVEKPTWDVPVL